MEFIVFVVLLLVSFNYVNCSNKIGRLIEAIDSSYLEDVLDAQACQRQLEAIRINTPLLLQFTDAGIRTPRGVLTGNVVDLGNYHQCLGIDQQLEQMHIQGKYCSILVPFNQSFELPRPQDLYNTHFNPSSLRLDNGTINKIVEYNIKRRQLLALSGNFDGFDHDSGSIPDNPLSNTVFRLGVCVPKPCTTEQAISSFFFNITAIGFQYTDAYCRLPDDKPRVPADTVLIVVCSLLGLLTLASTTYDLSYRFVFKKDVKQMNGIYRSFSVYTNGQRLTTFSSSAGNLQCLDGIRTLAMIWVIVGHSFTTETFVANPLDSFAWMFSAKALWITAAPMTVDTFFTLAGVLLVYTTAGKINEVTFIKNLHWFYLNRYLRVTPMLAMNVLLQTSYYNRMTDGPHWVTVADHTDRCRQNWWSTLLHVQNFVHSNDLCVSHSWYVALDFQLYVISPLILFWLLTGKKRLAWMILIGALAAVVIAATAYCFHINLQSGILVPSRPEEISMEYFAKYYYNTLTRGSPFLVGLIFGYLLHDNRKKKIRIPWFAVCFFWALSAGILGGIFYFMYRIKQFDWDNQLVDNIMNSFMRPAFALAICWLIVACVHGYAGPVNWFLSLDVWRLPSRLTYGMFIYHYPLMYTINSTMVAPIFFSVERFVFKFLSHLVLAVVVSFIFTLLVDSPVTVLFKQIMNSAKKKIPPKKNIEMVNDDNYEKNSTSKDLNRKIISVNTSSKAENYKFVDVNTDSDAVHVNLNDVNANSTEIQSHDILVDPIHNVTGDGDTELNAGHVDEEKK